MQRLQDIQNVEINLNPLTIFTENGALLRTNETSGVTLLGHLGRPLDLLGRTPVPNELLKWPSRKLPNVTNGA